MVAAAPALVAAAKEDAGCFPDSDPAMEEEDRDSSVECIESSVEAPSEPDPWRTDDVDLFTFVPEPDPVYGGRGYWVEVEPEVAAARRAEAAGEAEPAPRTILRAMPVEVVEPAVDAAAAAGSWRAPLADDDEPSEPGSEPEPDAAKIESEESDPEREPGFGFGSAAAAWLEQPKKEEESEMEDGAEIPVKACQTDPPSTL